MYQIIQQTQDFAKQSLAHAEAGHDWHHANRVWQLAKQIAQDETANLLVVELSALLHDIADYKFNDGDEELGLKKIKSFLTRLEVEEVIVQQVELVIKNVSFKGGQSDPAVKPIELAIVQDADRLDAMGAIGIARAFHFGGYKNRPLYDPKIKADLSMSANRYMKKTSPTINHFYEKLLRLKDKMNTKTGKRLAKDRHRFMEDFLKQFFKEWGE